MIGFTNNNLCWCLELLYSLYWCYWCQMNVFLIEETNNKQNIKSFMLPSKPGRKWTLCFLNQQQFPTDAMLQLSADFSLGCGQPVQPEIRAGFDDSRSSCCSMHLKSLSVFLTSGCLQWHCPCETLPSHTNHSLTKTRKSLQHGFPLLFSAHCGSALVGCRRIGEALKHVQYCPGLKKRLQGYIRLLFCVADKTTNSQFSNGKTRAAAAQCSRPPATGISSCFLCSMGYWALRHAQEMELNKLVGLNGRGNYRQLWCKDQQWVQVYPWAYGTQQQTRTWNWLSLAALLSVNLPAGFQTSETIFKRIFPRTFFDLIPHPGGSGQFPEKTEEVHSRVIWIRALRCVPLGGMEGTGSMV